MRKVATISNITMLTKTQRVGGAETANGMLGIRIEPTSTETATKRVEEIHLGN